MLDDVNRNVQEHRQWWRGDRIQLSGGDKTHGNLRVEMGDWQSTAKMGRKGPSAIHRAKKVSWTWEAEYRESIEKVMEGI